MNAPKPIGRPAGSGMQRPTVERIRQSRASRVAAGALRVDLTLDAEHAEKLSQLASHWQCSSRKEAIERAIATAFSTVRPRQP